MGYYGAREFGNPGPFHIKPKAHAKEEEMSKDERRRSKPPGDVAEDNPVLSKPRSRKEKAAHHQGQSPRASQGKAQVQWVNHGSIVEDQFQDKPSPHLRIKYPQLTSWPHLCGHDPWTVLSGSPQLTECQKEWLMGRALKYRHGWLTTVGPGWSKENYIM